MEKFKSVFKKAIATLMVVVLLICAAPLDGFVGLEFSFDNPFSILASAFDENEIIYGTDEGITRAEWLHNLAVVFEMTVEDEIYPDNYFSDLEDTHEYYYDVLLNVNFGVVDVEAGGEVDPDGLVTRSFASQTLNFCLGYQLEDTTYTFSDSASCEYPDDAQVAVNRGWFVLVSGKFMPETTVTDAEVKAMLEDAKNVLVEKVVDENYESEYTFDSSVIEIPNETEVTKEENIVKITNNPKTLKNGDKFAVYQNGIPKIYLATAVSTSQGVTTVTVDPDFDGNNLFLSIDAEGVTDISNLDITPDADTVMTVEEVPEQATTLQKSRGVIKLDKKYTFEKKVDIGEGLSVKCKVEMKNPKVEYQFKTDPVIRAQVIFDGDAEVTFSGEFDVLKSFDRDEIYIGTIGVPGIGGVALYVDLSLGGSVGLSTTGDLRFGFTYTKPGGFSTEKSFKSKSFSLVAEANAALGISAKFGVTDAPVVNAYVYFKIGGKATLKINDYADSKKPFECCNFSAYIYSSYGVKASIKVFGYTDSFDKKYEIWTATNSPLKFVRHYEDGKEVSVCARGNKIEYFTPWNSSYGGSGWSKGFGSTGYGRDGKPYTVYTYSLNEDNEATITSYKGNATALYIPSTIDGYKVVGIGDGVFKNNKYLRYVSVSGTVTMIGKDAFELCTALSTITIPDSVTEIGSEAFKYSGLTQLELPKNLIRMGNRVLEGTEVVSIKIPKTIETLSEYSYGTFYGSNIETVVFENGITKIPKAAFNGSSKLNNVTIPDTVTYIDNEAFAYCTALSTITIPDSVTEIGSEAFKYSGLTQLELPKNLIRMGNRVLEGTEVVSIKIPKTIETLSEYSYGTFYGSNIETVVFENGITKIPKAAFNGSSKLNNVTIPDTVTYIDNEAFAYCTALTTITIPDSVTEIGSGAFKYSGLTQLELPKNLIRMGNRVLEGTEVVSIKIPKTIETLSEYSYGTFYGSNIETVVFENGIIKIPKAAFNGSSKLNNVTIPDTVTYIDNEAFAYCTALTTITIPDSVTEIGSEAFMNSGLTQLKLPKNLTKMERGVVAGTKLTSFTIPDTIIEVKESVFSGCENLKSVKLSEACATISSNIFANCVSLEKIELPSSVTKVQDHAFKGCTALKEVVFNDKITTIDSYAFENCDALEKIAIPDSVNTFGEGVFYDCDALTNVTLGTGLTSLPASTFEHCDALVSVDLPYRTASIGDNAFKDCVKFTSITIPRVTTSIASNAFSYPTRLTINGVSGTYAETFANEIGATFVNKQVNATAVTIDKPTVTLNKGQSIKLVMNVTPTNFTDEVSWKSGDTNVATIAEDGTLTAKNVGTATIKLTVGNVSASCKVTVVQPVTSVNIDKSSVTMESLDTYQLNVSVNPSNAANKAVEWSSSASDIASVDHNGLVTAHKKGEATIRADAQDGSGKYDTCKIIVSNNGIIATSVSELESAHNYPVNCTDFWQYTLSGADSISVTFDERTNIEDGFDYLYIYDGDRNEVGRYTGTEISGKTITVSDDTIRIQLDSDDSGTEWGFKAIDVKIASAHKHSYTSKTTKSATCTATGIKTFTCSCGNTYTEAIKATGHTEQTIPAVSATCTKTGLTAGKKCSVCGTITVAQQTIKATGKHSKDNGTVTKKATYKYEGVKTYKCKVCGKAMGTEKIAKLTLGKVGGLKATSIKTTSLKLSWSKVAGAQKYEVQQYKSGKWKTIKTTSSTSYTVKDLKAGTTYKFRVRAVRPDDKVNGSYSSTLETKTKLATPKLTLKAGSKQLTASWKSVSDISGYEIQYSTSSKFTKKTTKTVTAKKSTTKTTIKKLTKGKKYYVRVRAYTTVNGKKVYSSWSTVKNVKVK